MEIKPSLSFPFEKDPSTLNVCYACLLICLSVILLNSGKALAPAEPDVALALLVSYWLVGWLGVTLYTSQQKQADI